MLYKKNNNINKENIKNYILKKFNIYIKKIKKKLLCF